MRLDILNICQRNLKRFEQIEGLAAAIKADEPIPLIEIIETEQGFQINNGHHRAVAYVVAGRTELFPYEYIFVHNEPRPEFGPLDLLVQQYQQLYYIKQT